MPRLLSQDLRERALEAIDAGISWREAAKIFQIGPATVVRLMRRKRM